MHTEEFDYDLPEAAIAQRPAERRDASRLMVVEPRTHTTFSRLGEHLTAGDLLVVNDSRVRAARLLGRRPSGATTELLLLNRRADGWEALARPSRKLRPGDRLEFGNVAAVVDFHVGEGRVVVTLEHEYGDDEKAIEEAGRVPYPPYVTDGPEDTERYQTVYASEVGSAAAPTAGLHFTPEMLAALEDQGISRSSISLDIGLGTFRPVTSERVDDHRMHEERYFIPVETAEAIDRTRTAGGRVVAVGTTVVRALESASTPDGSVISGGSSTSLFIRPGYVPRTVDAVVTNFHMPQSSLIVMIAALYPDWRSAYEEALQLGYRFLSFGDAMFIPAVR